MYQCIFFLLLLSNLGKIGWNLLPDRVDVTRGLKEMGLGSVIHIMAASQAPKTNE